MRRTREVTRKEDSKKPGKSHTTIQSLVGTHVEVLGAVMDAGNVFVDIIQMTKTMKCTQCQFIVANVIGVFVVNVTTFIVTLNK